MLEPEKVLLVPCSGVFSSFSRSSILSFISSFTDFVICIHDLSKQKFTECHEPVVLYGGQTDTQAADKLGRQMGLHKDRHTNRYRATTMYPHVLAFQIPDRIFNYLGA